MKRHAGEKNAYIPRSYASLAARSIVEDGERRNSPSSSRPRT